MRDSNNNYLSANLNLIHNSGHNGARNGGGAMTTTTAANNITCTAKVMWGTVGAISELREKEQAEKKRSMPNRKD